MKKSILVIGSDETFSVRGIEMKLKGIGFDASFCAAHIHELEKKCPGNDLLILHTDEEMDSRTDALVYLKDFCLEEDKQVLVVGTRPEYETVRKFLAEESVLDFFERPLDMDSFLEKTGEYLSDEAEKKRRKCILIVDDDVSYMSMIYDWLKDKYSVSMANSGMKAITYLAKKKADLILLDYEMPITPGPQVLEMIRSEAETSDIPVMFLTGKGDRESIMKVLSLKPEDYLLKTIDKKGLCEKIDTFFLKHRSR